MRRAADHGVIGRECSRAVLDHAFFIDHLEQYLVRQGDDFRDLVRSAEPVEEMQKRNTRFERGRVRDQRQVLRLLHRRRAKHCPAGRARGHHIAVIAEDRQRLCRERSRGDVKHGRRQFAGDLVHVRDHQQQSLRRRERRAERAGLKRTVDHSGSAAFALHLDHGRNRAPQILHASCRPRVRPFAHRRRRRDRINRDHLVERICDARHRLIRIQHFVSSLHGAERIRYRSRPMYLRCVLLCNYCAS